MCSKCENGFPGNAWLENNRFPPPGRRGWGCFPRNGNGFFLLEIKSQSAWAPVNVHREINGNKHCFYQQASLGKKNSMGTLLWPCNRNLGQIWLRGGVGSLPLLLSLIGRSRTGGGWEKIRTGLLLLKCNLEISQCWVRFSAANWAGRAFPESQGIVILQRDVNYLYLLINLFIFVYYYLLRDTLISDF